MTAIATGVDHIYYPQTFLNQDQPDWIYIAYLGVSAGTSTLTTSIPVVYALSKDRGLTWTKDIAMSTSTTDYRQAWTPLNGERFLVVWMDIYAVDLITNYNNSKEFGFTPEGIDITSTYKDNGANTCGVGSSDTASACWDSVLTSTKLIASTSTPNSSFGGTITRVRFKAEAGDNSNPTQGSYVATITLTAVTQ